jgi:serine/threonine protein kinase
MEYCEQGNLLTYQSKLPGKVFPLKHASKVVVEVMKALKCIHEKNFIHRDIKSENVLLKKEAADITYKIADFGFARSIGGVGAKTHCGTEKYMAPEIISNSYYGISVDIWALGVLFYFMLFAEYPFKGTPLSTQATT